MTDQRKRSSIGFWATVILVLPVLYPLSVGPAAWLCVHGLPSDWCWALDRFYKPVEKLAGVTPQSRAAYSWYIERWAARDDLRAAGKR